MTQQISDQLLRAIGAALERNPRINLHKWPIKVWAQDGKVVLDGTVADITAKRSAHAAAEKLCQDKCPVLDLLRIVPTEPRGDLELRDTLAKTLANEPAFRDYTLRATANDKTETVHDAAPTPHEIHALAHDGRVELRGQVGSLSHRRLAEVLAWWTGACTTVVNRLEVFPPEEDNDDEITDAVRMVLEKDPLVHADDLRAQCKNAVVTLEGCADNEKEKRLAVLDAWYVAGVREVRDHIEICG